MENIASPIPGAQIIAHCPGIWSISLPPPGLMTWKDLTSGVSCVIF